MFSFISPANKAETDLSFFAEYFKVQKRPFLIGFAQDDLSNDWRAAQVRDLENALAPYKKYVELKVTNARGQTAQQVKDIEDLAQQNIDLLITSPRDAQAMTPVISEIYRAGTPVILLSRRILNDDYTLFIGASNRDIGRQAADFLGQQEKPLNILILQHIPSSTPGIERTEGFLEMLPRYPQLNIVGIKRADSLRALAIQAVEQAIAEGLSFNAIYAQSDSMASGARLALQHAGIDPSTILTVGIDYINEARAAIRAGQQTASFTYPTFGQAGAEYAIKILQKHAIPKDIMLESVLVTKDNVERIDPIF
jgi:ribose transport system substrate-binding protein